MIGTDWLAIVLLQNIDIQERRYIVGEEGVAEWCGKSHTASEQC